MPKLVSAHGYEHIHLNAKAAELHLSFVAELEDLAAKVGRWERKGGNERGTHLCTSNVMLSVPFLVTAFRCAYATTGARGASMTLIRWNWRAAFRCRPTEDVFKVSRYAATRAPPRSLLLPLLRLWSP